MERFPKFMFFLLSVLSAGCELNEVSQSFHMGSYGTLADAPPTITSVPSSMDPRTEIIILGTGFVAGTQVYFKNALGADVQDYFALNSTSRITAKVPPTAVSGLLRISNSSGSALKSIIVNGTASPAAPTISSLPTNADRGTEIVILGTNFISGTNVYFKNAAGADVQDYFALNSTSRITAKVPPTAVSGAVRVANGSGSASQNIIINGTSTIAAPTITSLPSSADRGTEIVVLGTNFIAGSNVYFKNASGADVQDYFSISSATRIVAKVPATAVSGAVRVSNSAGSASQNIVINSTSTIGSPIITSMPANADRGTEIRIEGTNITPDIKVYFKNSAGQDVQDYFLWNSNTRVTAKVPPTAVSGAVRISNSVGSASQNIIINGTSTIAAPTISSMRPSANRGESLLIQGTNFVAGTAVYFKNDAGADIQDIFTINSLAQITAKVPLTAVTGPVRVSNSGGSAVQTLVVYDSTIPAAPTITSMPSSADRGIYIVIQGTNFVSGTNVYFKDSSNNDIQDGFTINSVSQITARVPAAAVSGPVRISNGGGSASRILTVNVAPPPITGAGYVTWKNTIQPLVESQCMGCHSGTRFAYASLQKAGSAFTEAESQLNYEKFFDLISLDNPAKSRLLGKILAPDQVGAQTHAGSRRNVVGDSLYNTILGWINQEKSDRCPSCGLSAPTQYVAYVKQPRRFWVIDKDPKRNDWGTRTGAKIMLQPVTPATQRPSGSAIDFLAGSGFCSDGDCDFGYLSVDSNGSQMAFECRKSVRGEAWASRSWNICVAGIGADGHAQNPHFLLPSEKLHSGRTIARTSPFGLLNSAGRPLKDIYDTHFLYRKQNDVFPNFSPDGKRVYFASQGDAVETYHGFDHIHNIVAATLDGQDVHTVYRNEGGQALHNFFRKNGNLVVHTWNLERMDRHMYVQMTADGMTELPVFFGSVQGPNQWGQATETINGSVIGMTGARRGTFDYYTPFIADHTLGTSLDSTFPAFRFLTDSLFNEIGAYPNGFCETPPNGANCSLSHFIADPSWSPDGRVFVSYNPQRTYGYFGEGSSIFEHYTDHNQTTEQRLVAATNYAPSAMGIALMNANGALETVIPNESGYMYRFPVWVGKRQSPRVQPWKTNESDQTATIHIADFKIWLSFAIANDGKYKASLMRTLDTIKSVRVLYKDMEGNACIRDTGAYWSLVHNLDTGNHPTAFGIVDSTGFIQLRASTEAGGNGWGDVDLKDDDSVKLKLPANKILLFQGINAEGHVVAQRSRLSSLPAGQHDIQASVKRGQYYNQCASCHGVIDGQAYPSMADLGTLDAGLDFNTTAAQSTAADLTAPTVVRQKMTYLHALQPIIQQKCMSCHSGSNPKAELSLATSYSRDGNYPAGLWADSAQATSSAELRAMTVYRRPSYDYSVSYRWLFHKDENEYKNNPEYLSLQQNDTATGELSPYSPGYQNLFRRDPSGTHWYYLSQRSTMNSFGRSANVGGNSSTSYLIERLTGRDLDTSKSQGSGTFVDHSHMLTEEEKRLFMGVIDIGFPYMSRCDDRTIPSGPNAGKPWGAVSVDKIND